jgi:hypothetical protein
MSNLSVRRGNGESFLPRPTRNGTHLVVALMVAAGGLLVAPAAARAADANACGDIQVSSGQQCSAVVETNCTTQCEPVSFVLACDGKCSGSCTETATTTCTQECGSWCITECESDPGSFSCQASCSSNCETSCPGKCHDHPDQGKCEASCRTSCSTECTASCTVVPPTETCATRCGTCCDTSCTVQRNVECAVACEIECGGSLQGSCDTQCQDPKGAIFCDGQYVDTGDLQGCVDYLQSIDISVDVNAWGSASVDSKGGVSCAITPGTSGRSGTTAALAGLALLPLIVLRRRFHR